MISKKEKILSIALELFANNGFHATSTKKIAINAGVSEGLIFRHFKNKEGLLEAILDYGHQKANELFNAIDEGKSLQDQLRFLISIPFRIDESDFPFWKLMYALKWQTDQYDESISQPFKDKLSSLLENLKYRDPEVEAEIILMFFDGAATAFLLKGIDNKEAVLQSILKKYNL